MSLIGPSGCGKSTLLRIVGDLIAPSSGEVLVNGKTAVRARRDRDYGMVFQAPVLFEWRTVEDNVKLPLEVLGYDASAHGGRRPQMLDLVELGDFVHHSRGSSPEACSSASRSPARSPSSRRSCSWTSRSARSTR